MPLDRRSFLKAAIAGAGATALGAPAARAVVPHVNLTTPLNGLLGGPEPRYPNIRHVVVVMMENRSTDHYLGWWGDRPPRQRPRRRPQRSMAEAFDPSFADALPATRLTRP